MIELPEAVSLSKQINACLAGKEIIRVLAASAPHKFAWYAGDPEEYGNMLPGQKIKKARNAGGMVEIELNDMILLLMEGVNIRFHESSAGIPKKHQLLVHFSDSTALSCSIQMYGGICCFYPGKYENVYYDTAKKKPDLLSDEFSEGYFSGLIDNKEMSNLSVKAFLATEQRVPGLGNGILQEILYEAMVNPKRKISSLSPEEKKGIFKALKNTVKRIADLGGRNTEKDIFGRPGGFSTRASKNTVGKPCGRCGFPVVKSAHMGGSVYYCETCQPL